ncbi:hypothetical protein D3C72_2422630 [compost metagenome]
MMLKDAPRYITISFGPSRRMPLMSTARVSSTSAAGSRMSRATGLYRWVFCPSIRPTVL